MSLRDFRFVEDFIGGGYVQLPDSATGRIGPIQLYPLQEQFCRALLDERDDAGIRRYRRALFCVPKKFGKAASARSSGSTCCSSMRFIGTVSSIHWRVISTKA